MASHQPQQKQFQDQYQVPTHSQTRQGLSGSGSSANGKVQIDFHHIKESQILQSQFQHQQQNQISVNGKGGQQQSTAGAHIFGSNEFFSQDYEGQDGDPSPIYGGNAYPRVGALANGLQTDNFIDNNFKVYDQQKDDQKRLLEQQKQVALKRRSIETKEGSQQNKQPGFDSTSNSRFQVNGARSALSNYGTQQQQQNTQPIKQINKNAKVEKDPLMDNLQQKRSLAKSQSQNRLVLVSPETLLNKNQLDNQGGIVDKNSFFKGNNGNNNPDLLYKQHMQYGNYNNQHKSWHLKASNNNLLLSRMTTTKSECTFCTRTGVMHSTQLNHCSSIYCSKDQQGMMIQNQLSKKYSTNRDYYNLKIVNDLIYNENTHIVSIFKDYLILDDINEFLKRSYNQQETKVRLPKLCSFYDKYSQVFPNYVCLPESKYMFKNIQRKQKLIDEQYQLQEEIAKKQHQTLLDEDKLFNTKFYNSYYSNMGDISMTKKQYEEQAKQISKNNGPVRLDQMRFDELVDRFLLKDSQSNIQLITTAGLDFSGFTNSTFLHNHSLAQDGKTPSKVSAQQVNPNLITKNQQQSKPQQQQPMKLNNAPSKQQQQQVNKQASQQQLQQKKAVININVGVQLQQQQIVMVNQPSAANKRQKNSFNNNQQQQKVGTYPGQAPKIDTNRMVQNMNNGGSESSTKTTPRLQRQPQTQSIQILNTHEASNLLQNQKQIIQASPGTKEAISSYLNNQFSESTIDEQNQLRQLTAGHPIHTLSLHVTDLQKTQNLAASMGSLLSPSSIQSQYPPNYHGESPNPMKSPQHNLAKTSQINARQTIKSQQQTSLGGTQSISNLKGKTNARLSNGGGNNKKISDQRKNASPVPQQQQQQQTMQTQQSSRNLQVVSNSTQKSVKSVNSHAKYLSGGNEQYQKLLVNLQTTSYDTMQQSSTKKPYMIHQRETFITQNSQQKQDPLNEINEGVVTGEDCDDCGIADERFASPEAHQLVFQTLDDVGRKSLEGTGNSNLQQMILSSAEGGLFDNNYDQIKKHLELQCINKKSGTFDNNQGSLQQQQQQNSIDKPSRNDIGSQQKQYESMKQQIRGAFDNQSSNNTMDGAQNYQINSGNKTPNKSSTHSKKSNTNTNNMILLQQNRMSLESNILVMPNSNTNQQLPLTSTSANGRQLSFSQTSFQNNANNYRSITNLQQRKSSNQHIMKQQQENSIETKRLSGQINRQSFKDLQQQQVNVQTALNEQQKVIKRSVTGKTLNIYEANSHSHTFGQIQPNQFYNQLSNTISTTNNTASLQNPTFISQQQQQQNKQYSTTSHQQHNQMNAAQSYQQQQAANTVRVMTPSYSLASLSKLISPTQGTSPMTMTVTLAGGNAQNNTIGRKQLVSNQIKGGKTSLGVHQNASQNQYQQLTPSTNLASSHSQNFLLATDKSNQQQKLVTSSTTSNLGQKGIISSKANHQMNKRTNNTASINTLQIATTLNQKLGRQQYQVNHTLQQSNSQQTFQITPRGQVNLVDSNNQQQNNSKALPLNQQMESNSQNLSCTVSTENNSTAKAFESKHPKFMRTIEEISNNPGPSSGAQQYNTVLSSTMAHRKSGGGGATLTTSISQAQFDIKQNQRQKVQTVVNSNQSTIKRNTIQGGQMLSSSASVSHFKSPSQQLNPKKQQLQGRYLNNM